VNAPSRLKDVKTPEFLDNLFRDMRDRGLLPVAGLLVVAILAVPFILGGGAAAPPPPAAATGASSAPVGAGGTSVVVSNHGVRVADGRRLGTRKDPFQQKFNVINTTGSALGAGLAAGIPIDDSAAADAGSSSTSSGSGSGSGSGGSGSGGDSGGSGGGGSGGGGSGGDTSSTEVTAASYQVDTRITKTETLTSTSTTENKDDVAFLDALPDDTNPVFVFAGVTEDAKKAMFLLPNSVSLTGGICVIPISAIPAGFSCPLVALKPGDEILTTYGPDPLHTYKLKLDSIHQPS
jgi:hypothetical protein